MASDAEVAAPAGEVGENILRALQQLRVRGQAQRRLPRCCCSAASLLTFEVLQKNVEAGFLETFQTMHEDISLAILPFRWSVGVHSVLPRTLLIPMYKL